MQQSKFKFTLKRISELQVETTRKRYYDTDNRGLVLEVMVSGRKVFRSIKRNGATGIVNNVTIGPFPSVTVESAIKQHAAIISEIIKGNDPNEAKRKTKRRGIIFSNLYEIYDLDFAAKVKRDERRVSSREHNARLFRNHLSLELDDKRRRLADITLEQIDPKYASKLIDNLKLNKSKAVFNKSLTMLKSMFNLAVSKQLIAENPFLGQKKFRDTERKRYIQNDEIQQFFDAVLNVNYLGRSPSVTGTYPFEVLLSATRSFISLIPSSATGTCPFRRPTSATGKWTLPIRGLWVNSI